MNDGSLNKGKLNGNLEAFKSVAGIFMQAQSIYPKRPALIAAGQTWTYEELGSAAAAALKRLSRIFYGNPGDRVDSVDSVAPVNDGRIAIIGENHPAYIVAYWAAQCAGCSTVEVGANESLQTLLGVLSATSPRFVVTDRDDLKSAIQGKIPVESFDEFLLRRGEPDELSGASVLALPEISAQTPAQTYIPTSAQMDESREASIIYTSGTTAAAKGVVLSQGNFCFIAAAVADYLFLNEKDRCALILPLCHTYGKSVLLSAAAAGAAVVMSDGFGDRQKFLSELVAQRCTVISAVPYHLNTLVKSGCLTRYDFSSIRAITSSADKLAPSVIESLAEALPGVQIFSMYGLTEATTRACYVPPDMLRRKKESCGRPLPRVEIRIVTEDGRAAGTDETGEVLLRGPNIMTGYWNDPELTAETLVDGWLKTGDLGHMDADGFLYLDGRSKDIIKCAGERINPSEIEEILMEHHCVKAAAVVGRPDLLLGETIHAYVESSDPSLTKADLREHCLAGLPRNKVPYKYTIVERLPRTDTTGKVQKHKL